MKLPKLYPIVDAGLLASRGIAAVAFARQLRDAGLDFLQYRDKTGSNRQIVAHAEAIGELFTSVPDATLIMNDRIDLMMLARWHGVHVGQGDMMPADVRIVIGDGRVIGLSSHTEEQVRAADGTVADYVAIGPVFATQTKLDAAPAVGLEGVRRARALTSKPLVAIGGITVEHAQSVIEAGADSVAVISGLLAADGSACVAEFLRALGG